MLENITFCDIYLEDLRYTDPNIVKLFTISQLCIEYLLYSQDALAERKAELESEAKTLKDAAEKLNKDKTKLTDEIAGVKKENRALRKTVYAYQLMTKMPGAQPAFGDENLTEVAVSYYKTFNARNALSAKRPFKQKSSWKAIYCVDMPGRRCQT
jgi:hypothetical protein